MAKSTVGRQKHSSRPKNRPTFFDPITRVYLALTTYLLIARRKSFERIQFQVSDVKNFVCILNSFLCIYIAPFQVVVIGKVGKVGKVLTYARRMQRAHIKCHNGFTWTCMRVVVLYPQFTCRDR